MQINRIIEPPTKVSAEAEEDVTKDGIGFVTHLITLVKETARDTDLLAPLLRPETKKDEIIPNHCSRFQHGTATQFRIIFLDDKENKACGMPE